jgi:lipoate-protein ligase A
MTAWPVEHLTGDAHALHHRQALEAATRKVVVLGVTAPALVLGTTQRTDDVDAEVAHEMGVDVVHRRTGGGAVFLVPGEHVWIDVTVPAGDVLWHDDVGKAFDWLGHVWDTALHAVGVGSAVVNEAAVCHSILGRLICFGGLGFGEVSGPRGKIVGISQRRTRDGAWFQCAVMRRWDIEPYRRLLAPGIARVTDDSARELADIRVQSVAVDAAALVDAFVAHLPT